MADLRTRAAVALADPRLRTALATVTDTLAERLAQADDLSNLDELKVAARAVRNEVISNLPELLASFADNVEAAGGRVHWAADAAEATGQINRIVDEHQAQLVVKSKSMLTEEIGLNEALEARGVEVVETDLGEWIVQLDGQPPSHIIAPAIHLNRDDVAAIFNRTSEVVLSNDPAELCGYARTSLRSKFLAADVGITGCNFAVAETGTVVLVTNEGNGRMVTSVPPVHVVVMGMERIVETWDQLDLMLALLARSATGQALSVYTSQTTGPRRDGETDGPDELHVVIVDNGRSEIIGTEFQEMLHCIRCGACLNVCPVYRQIGGHAYDSVYSGPMGAVLTPLLSATDATRELADASTLCGACHDVCPVGIPLQDLLLAARRAKRDEAGRLEQQAWRAWAAAWRRPAGYRASLASVRAGAGRLPSSLLPASWTRGRAAPASRGRSNLRERLKRGEL